MKLYRELLFFVWPNYSLVTFSLWCQIRIFKVDNKNNQESYCHMQKDFGAKMSQTLVKG